MKRFFISLSTVLAATVGLWSQSRAVTFLGQLTYNSGINDVWGWKDTAANKEYALVGVDNGLSIVDISIPASPSEVKFFGGATSIWRDMKTWKHYAYTVHDFKSRGTDQGIFIVDLKTINQSTPVSKSVKPSITLGGRTQTLDRAHNIYIDENGVLYVFGANVGNGGALMFDVATDPMNPSYLGAFDASYLHDGMARGDTLWGSAINQGQLLAIDVSNKGQTQVMGSTNTPDNFTHNAWVSDDNRTVYTTDERTNAYVTAYDVSDLKNINELDRIQTSLDNNVIPHNTHFYRKFLVTSYYTSGLQIVDAHRPDILVETAYFDSSPFGGDGFSGAWGAYPWLPSGNILVSDREQGLFILSSTYPRAAYLDLFVKDSATGLPLANARVQEVQGTLSGVSDLAGFYKIGKADTGTVQFAVRMAGYQNDTVTVNLQAGQTASLTAALIPFGFSLGERELPRLHFYPNPSEEVIHIAVGEWQTKPTSVVVRNTAGQVVRRHAWSATQKELRLEHHLPKGWRQAL